MMNAVAKKENAGYRCQYSALVHETFDCGELRKFIAEANGVPKRRVNINGSTDIFIDAWCPGIGEQEIQEKELLEGELSAITFRVGCYVVRSAQRVYKVYELGYSPELEILADREETEMVKKAGGSKAFEFGLGGSDDLNNRFRLTHEISARHISSFDYVFTYICRATRARNYAWMEWIGDIYVAKEDDKIPDKDASLFVYLGFENSSRNKETWYKMSPDGKVTVVG